MSDTTLNWYFDFISPFAYLQWRLLRREHPQIALNPKPVLLAALLNHHGQLGPAEIPGKRRHTYRMVLWQAREAGVPLVFPPAHPFNPLPALRLCLAAADRQAATDVLFVHIWEQGRAADSIEALADVARVLGIDDLASAIARDEIKHELLANGENAIALGIFGVPTLRIGNELFWGNDATPMALQFLADPDRFDDAQMRRVDGIPAAVKRNIVRA